jgi:hypothetical protein
MKTSFFFGLVVLFAASLSTATFAAEPCPQGSSCSEHYELKGTVTTISQVTEKKVLTAEELEAYRIALAKASSRDHDQVAIIKGKNSTICAYPTDQFNNWLIETPDVVVDRKEFPAPVSHNWGTSGHPHNECTAFIIVHYHKKEVTK